MGKEIGSVIWGLVQIWVRDCILTMWKAKMNFQTIFDRYILEVTIFPMSNEEVIIQFSLLVQSKLKVSILIVIQFILQYVR